MLKVKHLTVLSQKIEKGGNVEQGCKKKSRSARIFLQPSVAF